MFVTKNLVTKKRKKWNKTDEICIQISYFFSPIRNIRQGIDNYPVKRSSLCK